MARCWPFVAGQPALATVEGRQAAHALRSRQLRSPSTASCAIGDDKLDTIAIETLDAEAAFAVLNKVGLGEAQNESYAEFLQRRLF